MTAGRQGGPVGYGSDWLGAVLPGVAAALGHPTGLPSVAVPAARAICLVLVDGLGAELLAAADAPFLGGLDGDVLEAGCPTTTVTSLASLATGLPPGRHGLVGYEVLDPARGVLFNELRWDDAVDPLVWQPHPTLLEELAAAGVAVTRIGNPEFDGSGLTRAAQRGGEFLGVDSLEDRVTAAVGLLGRPGRSLVYLYWSAVDGNGHVHGVDSDRWRRAVSRVDAALARLAGSLPADSALVVTADHGMVDVPHADRLDLARVPSLRHGVDMLGGEPRFGQVYCRPGAAPAVARRLSDAIGDRARVVLREEAAADGWFGAIEPRVLPRIGDVLVAARGTFALVDSDTQSPDVLKLIGQHGSLTPAEQRVPLLVVSGAGKPC